MKSLLSRLAFWWAALAVGLSVLLPSPLGSWVAALAAAAAAVSLFAGRGDGHGAEDSAPLPSETSNADLLEVAAMLARGAARARDLPEALHSVARVLFLELGANGLAIGQLDAAGGVLRLERFANTAARCPVPVNEGMSGVAAEAIRSQRIARGAQGEFAVPVLAAGRPVAWLEFKSLEVAVAAPMLLRLLDLVCIDLSVVAAVAGPPTLPTCCSLHGAAGAVAHDPSPTGVLDPSTLDRLRQLDPNGVNRLLERVVKAFEASTMRLVPQLREGARTGDLDGVRQVAHNLRSASASIGALKLSKLCAEIEAQVRANQPEDLAGRVKAAVGEVDVVLGALRSLPAART